jgi:hypothetical protein
LQSTSNETIIDQNSVTSNQTTNSEQNPVQNLKVINDQFELRKPQRAPIPQITNARPYILRPRKNELQQQLLSAQKQIDEAASDAEKRKCLQLKLKLRKELLQHK